MNSYPIYIFSKGQVATLYPDGDIWADGACVGHLYENGEVYSTGRRSDPFPTMAPSGD